MCSEESPHPSQPRPLRAIPASPDPRPIPRSPCCPAIQASTSVHSAPPCFYVETRSGCAAGFMGPQAGPRQPHLEGPSQPPGSGHTPGDQGLCTHFPQMQASPPFDANGGIPCSFFPALRFTLYFGDFPHQYIKPFLTLCNGCRGLHRVGVSPLISAIPCG